MFGQRMEVETEGGFTLILRPYERSEVTNVRNLQSMSFQRFLGASAPTAEDELEWFDSIRKDTTSYVWAIEPKGYGRPIGSTSLDKLGGNAMTCVSGIFIEDQDWWGRGVAKASHLARTLYAVDTLHRFKIKSQVNVLNEGSWRALLSVGYFITGTEPRDAYNTGKFSDVYRLTWLNPERVSIMYPEGAPEQYLESIEKAEEALVHARKVVRRFIK